MAGGNDYQADRARYWPPTGIDTGRRAPWLSLPLTRDRLREITSYIRAVLLGDDSVEPNLELAEAGLSLLAGLLAPMTPLDELLTEIDNTDLVPWT